MQRGKPPEWWEKQKGSRGIRRGQWYRLVFQFPIREQFGVVFNQTTAPTTALQQQYERANESANVAITAYNHAIGTALAEASANKASTASAVAALVPDSVLDELNKAAQ
ncbi:TPA: hypothetical protein HNC75_14630 [Escherichia coli]|nr:hypothetical protein [Escherichia coli]